MRTKAIMIILVMAVAAISLSGCKDTTKEDLEEATMYDNDKEVIEYSLNTSIYSKAIEDILYYDGGDINDIKRVINENIDIISDDFIEVLYSRGQVFEETTDDNDLGDDSDWYVDDPVENAAIVPGAPDDTIQETDEHALELEDDTPVFSVTGMDAYSDRLIASVAYKYGSPMKVWVSLVDGKIDGYRIYR
jgi:hypothetical protein